MRFFRNIFLSVSLLISLISLISCDQDSSQLANTKKIVTVDNRADSLTKADHTDIKTAVISAADYTRIEVAEGVYIVDNPVILKQEGVRIIGKGKDKTLIYPKNAGKEVFIFAANNLSIEGIGINAKIRNGPGRATFAIHIERGFGNCRISEMKILNTGATAIIGHSVNDCLVNGNVIVNTGDDGIRMRGSRLTISKNIIFRYFDEAIDLGGGENILVNGNFASSGRIGITVGADDAIIDGNTVENHMLEGIVLASKHGGIVSHNSVSNGGRWAYNLLSPLLIASNRVDGKNQVGFRIHNMRRGVIRDNVIVNADLGITITRGMGNLISCNRYLGNAKQAMRIGEDSHNNYADENCMFGSDGVKEKTEVGRGNLTRRLLGTHLKLESQRASLGEIDVKGYGQGNKKFAETLERFLNSNNPGFLSVHVRRNSMRSEITNDLYTTLKGAGQLAIGSVRAPYMLFESISGSYFPLWHLTVADQEVAIVSQKQTGAGVQLFLKEDGKLGLRNTLSLSKARFRARLNHIYRRIKRLYWSVLSGFSAGRRRIGI